MKKEYNQRRKREINEISILVKFNSRSVAKQEWPWSAGSGIEAISNLKFRSKNSMTRDRSIQSVSTLVKELEISYLFYWKRLRDSKTLLARSTFPLAVNLAANSGPHGGGLLKNKRRQPETKTKIRKLNGAGKGIFKRKLQGAISVLQGASSLLSIARVKLAPQYCRWQAHC